MSRWTEPDSHIRDKVKLILDFTINATKKELNDAAVLDTSNLAVKYDFIVLKDENDKLDIKK